MKVKTMKIKTRWRGWQSNNASDSERSNHRKAIQQEEGVKFPHPDYVIARGRYRGTKIKDLTYDYLEWCIEKHGWGWAKDELARRYGSFEYDD